MKHTILHIILLYITVTHNLIMVTHPSRESIFTEIYTTNFWSDTESVSGQGSNLHQTAVIRKKIPELLRNLGIQTVLDIPCGDFYWMNSVDLSFLTYIGADIVQELITQNQQLYGSPTKQFIQCDLVTGPLPKADLIICRDCLVHLPFNDILQALQTIKQSGARYLLVTTFTQRTTNYNIATAGDWRPLNMQKPPFNFPEPLTIINEECSQNGNQFTDKCLGLWLLDSITLNN